MNVKRTELLKALKQCLPGIESGKSSLEGADLFIFSKGFVHSYNDIISVAVPIKSDDLLEQEIEGAVRAEEFYGIINKLSGDLIEFTVENDKWVLKSGKAKAQLTLMSGDFTKRFETIAPDKKKWLEIPSEFTQGLGICRMPNNKKSISGIYITQNDMSSSDGLQINRFEYKGADFENFWISDASANELLKVGILTHIQLKGTWAHFKTNDNTTFSVKTLQAEDWPYEKINDVLEAHKKKKTSVSMVFPKELFDAIDRASSFCFDISNSRAVKLTITPKNILVSAERIAGKFEEKVMWDKDCPQFDAFDLYVDIEMMLFIARRSLSFYIHETEQSAPRMVFTTDNSTHLMATLSVAAAGNAGAKKEEGKGTAKKAAKKEENEEPDEEAQGASRTGESGSKGKAKKKAPPPQDDADEGDEE